MHNNDKKLILKFNSKLFEINLRNTETAKLIAESVPIKSKIQTLSGKLLKYLLKLDPQTPTNILNNIFKNLKILKVDDLIKVNTIFFGKKNALIYSKLL